MTIGITGPERKAPGRNAVAGLIIIAIVIGVFLILLGLVGGFLVDWMWFSAIGYPQIFWTTIGTKAGVFFVVFVATAAIVWVDARLALSFAQRRRGQLSAGFAWKLTTTTTPPDPFEFMRNRLPWPLTIAGSSGLVALLVAFGEVSNWSASRKSRQKRPIWRRPGILRFAETGWWAHQGSNLGPDD